MSADGLAVRSVEAVALSVDLRNAANAVTLGTGTAIKKDVVVVTRFHLLLVTVGGGVGGRRRWGEEGVGRDLG